MKKFGLSDKDEEKETLEKRKQKFKNSDQMVNEDDEALKKRREKFGMVESTQPEDKSKLDERKKKFGNPENDIALEDEIKKSKHITKDFSHRKNFNQNNKFFRRNDRNFRR